MRNRVITKWHRRAHFDPDGTISPDDLLSSFGKLATIQAMLSRLFGEAWHGYATEGEVMPNIRLLHLDDSGVSECRLLDFIREGRPLVLNLGSCS